MTDEQFDRLEAAITEHGNQLGVNLVHLKRFVDEQRVAQETFWADQHAANEEHQQAMLNASRWSAFAATAAAVTALVTLIGGIV